MTEEEMQSAILEIKDRVKKIEVDMYFGDGRENPPMTMRVSRLEDVAASMKRVEWLLFAAIVTALPNLIVLVIKGFH